MEIALALQTAPAFLGVLGSVMACGYLSITNPTFLKKLEVSVVPRRELGDNAADVEPFLGYHEPPDEESTTKRKLSNKLKKNKNAKKDQDKKKDFKEEEEFGPHHKECWNFFTSHLGPWHDDADPSTPVGRSLEFNASNPGDYSFPYSYCESSRMDIGSYSVPGHAQMRALGRSLRNIYLVSSPETPDGGSTPRSDGVEWLHGQPKNGVEIIEPDDVHIRSTDVWRTMQSVESLLVGMYPHGRAQGVEAKWRIHVRPRMMDPLSVSMGDDGGGGSWCPRLTQLRKKRMRMTPWGTDEKYEKEAGAKKRMKGERYKNGKGCDALFAKTADKMHKELDALIGAAKHGGKDLERWFDSLRCRYCHNKAKPCGPEGCVTDEMQDMVFRMAGWFLRNEFGRWDEQREEEFQLRVGPLLKELAGRMVLVLGLPSVHQPTTQTQEPQDQDEDARAAEKEEEEEHMRTKRVFVYSSHDTTISAMLRALRIPDGRWPGYAANLIFEEWFIPSEDNKALDPKKEGRDNYYVRVLYNGRPQKVGRSEEYLVKESEFLPWLLNTEPSQLNLTYPLMNGNGNGKSFEEACEWIDE
ncbi:Acid phosphatase-like protein 2 [Chytridiales sp. JEL 0842]|nr:Acid phosphatase-like protein 2 [Chytridiales sp. JEL 0842]